MATDRKDSLLEAEHLRLEGLRSPAKRRLVEVDEEVQRATLVPARRAVRVAPTIALRSE